MSKRIEAKNLDIYYGDFKAVEGVSMIIEPRASPRSSARPAAASPPSCGP
jgi:hypothetical protein